MMPSYSTTDTKAPPTKKDVVAPIVVKFKEEEGVMTPQCFCRSHDLEGRTIYEMHEMDPEQNETALQIYTSAYKSSHHDDSFALIRKAKRLDESLPRLEYALPDRSCVSCHVDVSPRWHLVENGMEIDGRGEEYQCHQCWFNQE